MAGQKTKTELMQKNRTAYEQLWLTYYNDALYTKGLITEQQRNRMRIRIISRAGVRK